MYPHYRVPIILPGLCNYYPHVPSLHSPYHFTWSVQLLPPCTLFTHSLSFYPVCIITTPIYPRYTFPIILPGLYNYYPHVPSSHSPYHFTLSVQLLPSCTLITQFLSFYLYLHHFILHYYLPVLHHPLPFYPDRPATI
jgi:hypothetical protein